MKHINRFFIKVYLFENNSTAILCNDFLPIKFKKQFNLPIRHGTIKLVLLLKTNLKFEIDKY
jgi:hypothetical protein